MSYILVGLVILVVVNKVFDKVSNRSIHLKFLKSFIDVVIVSLVGHAYLSKFEATRDISKTILQSGTLLIAIATFAAQKVLANVISGIAITASKPFNIGDKIKVVDGGSIVNEGIIVDINLRHTIIKKYDGQCDIVPNSVMDSAVICNTNLIDNVGNFIEIEVSYDSDIDKAIKILRGIVVSHNLTVNDNESTKVLIKDFTSNGVLLRVLVTTRSLDDSFQACSDIRHDILKKYTQNNIDIPYQTVTLIER